MRAAARTPSRPAAALESALGAIVKTPRRLGAVLAAGVALFALVATALDPARAQGIIGIPGPGDVGLSIIKKGLDWLLADLKAEITLGLVKFLTTITLPVGGWLEQATGPIIVIGGFWLVVGLITSVGVGYREIVAGTDTAARVIGSAIFRVIGLALLLGAWFWIVPLTVDVANGMSAYVLDDAAVKSALSRTFAGETNLTGGSPLLGLVAGIFLAISMLVLVVAKFVIAFAFAGLYVGGPALIGFAALPGVGRMPLAMVSRGLVTLTVIPLAWTVVFVAWAGVSAGQTGGGIANALAGPGLFFAGLLVMLAVTKKLLSMATFGLGVSVPGAGIARSVLNIAAAKALLGGGGVSGAGADLAKPPVKGDTHPEAGEPLGSGGGGGGSGQQARANPAGRAQPNPQYRQLDTSRRAPTQNPSDARTWDRAHTETTQRLEQDSDASAIGEVRGGSFRGSRTPPLGARDAPRTPSQELNAEIAGYAKEGPMSPEDLREGPGRILPHGDISAQTRAARTATNDFPNDPQRAGAAYRENLIGQYAGTERLDRHPDEREAVARMAAQPPQTIDQTFGPEADKYAWRQRGESSQSPPTTNYDAGIAMALGESRKGT